MRVKHLHLCAWLAVFVASMAISVSFIGALVAIVRFDTASSDGPPECVIGPTGRSTNRPPRIELSYDRSAR